MLKDEVIHYQIFTHFFGRETICHVYIKCIVETFCSTMETNTDVETPVDCGVQEIVEGHAKIRTGGKVFYNVVQEFNRDLR